jgi:hypothetical protein
MFSPTKEILARPYNGAPDRCRQKSLRDQKVQISTMFVTSASGDLGRVLNRAERPRSTSAAVCDRFVKIGERRRDFSQ